MSDKKPTDVQWLIEEMLRIEKQNHPKSIALKLFFESSGIVISKALQMHKQQAFEFWQGGIACTEEGGKSFDQYYNETFQP